MYTLTFPSTFENALAWYWEGAGRPDFQGEVLEHEPWAGGSGALYYPDEEDDGVSLFRWEDGDMVVCDREGRAITEIPRGLTVTEAVYWFVEYAVWELQQRPTL